MTIMYFLNDKNRNNDLITVPLPPLPFYYMQSNYLILTREFKYFIGVENTFQNATIFKLILIVFF